MDQNRNRPAGRGHLQGSRDDERVDPGVPRESGAGVRADPPVGAASRATGRPADVTCEDLAEVIARYHPYVWGIINNMGMAADGEVIVQEVFLGFGRHYQGNGMPEKVTSMLVAITVNKVRDCLRVRDRERQRASETDVDFVPASQRTPEDLCYGLELARIVREILDKLPADHRLALIGAELCDMTPDEIAQGLGIPSATVRTHLKRAKARFLHLARDVYKLEIGGLR
jgi:RNA polymerase sigma-70 factor, ECF subfamily